MTDINKETVYVTINSARRIPFLNASGPINTPISIFKTIAEQLKALGFPVKEHPYVGINSATGNRSIMTEEAFVARQEGQIVDVVTTEPAPAFVPSDTTEAPAPVSEVTIVDQPKEIVEEPTDETTANVEELDADSVDSEETEADSDLGDATTDEATAKVEELDVDSADSEETTSEEATEEESSDSEDLDVYDYAVYEGWSKQLLVSYLRKAEQFLPEEVRAETNSANKTRLLAIVKQYIVDVAE